MSSNLELFLDRVGGELEDPEGMTASPIWVEPEYSNFASEN